MAAGAQPVAVDLQALFDDDELVRAQTGRVQVRSEFSFGMRERPAERVRLADGREIWLRGSADRVDRAGTALVVVDYKTGSPRRSKLDILEGPVRAEVWRSSPARSVLR